MSEPGYPFGRCARCGHLGWSHDNAQDCAECECPVWLATLLEEDLVGEYAAEDAAMERLAEAKERAGYDEG